MMFIGIVGVNNVDAANSAAKQTWMQDQLDLAVYHASIAPYEDGLNEGIKEITFSDAENRFYSRLALNSGLIKTGSTSQALQPTPNKSLTLSPVGVNLFMIPLAESKTSWQITYSFDGTSWQQISKLSVGSSGDLTVKIQTPSGRILSLPPKHLQGASLIALAYVNEGEMNQYTKVTEFPVVSVQSIFNIY